MKMFIGWLANFYPKHFFYASDFGKDWDMKLPEGTHREAHTTTATTALLAVAVAAGENITEVGGRMSAEYTSVTSGGQDVGSYRVTVEKISAK